MSFKAIFQAFRRGWLLKFIDVTTNFRIFIKKKVTKFAGLQTLQVTPAHAHRNNIGGELFSYQ